MKKIAVLLANSIKTDYRVSKTIRSLSQDFEIDLFYIGNKEDVIDHFYGFENVRTYPLHKRGGFRVKVIEHSFFTFKFMYIMKHVLASKTQYDIIWSNDLTTLRPGCALSKTLKAKLIYDSHEIYTETINQFFPIKSNKLKSTVFSFVAKLMKLHGKNYERRAIKNNVDLFITVNHSLMKYFESQYSLKDVNRYVLYNYPSKRIFNNQGITDRLNLPIQTNPDDYLVIYQSIFNEGRGIRHLIDSFIYLDNTFKLFMVGSGSMMAELKQRISDKGLNDRIFFIGESTENYYTKVFDLGVNFTENINLSKSMASPNKVFQYIFAEIPVLLSYGVENESVLKQFKIGELVELDPMAIAEKMRYMRGINKEVYKTHMKSAQEVFLWENQIDKLLNKIKEI